MSRKTRSPVRPPTPIGCPPALNLFALAAALWLLAQCRLARAAGVCVETDQREKPGTEHSHLVARFRWASSIWARNLRSVNAVVSTSSTSH